MCGSLFFVVSALLVVLNDQCLHRAGVVRITRGRDLFDRENLLGTAPLAVPDVDVYQPVVIPEHTAEEVGFTGEPLLQLMCTRLLAVREVAILECHDGVCEAEFMLSLRVFSDMDIP